MGMTNNPQRTNEQLELVTYTCTYDMYLQPYKNKSKFHNFKEKFCTLSCLLCSVKGFIFNELIFILIQLFSCIFKAKYFHLIS